MKFLHHPLVYLILDIAGQVFFNYSPELEYLRPIFTLAITVAGAWSLPAVPTRSGRIFYLVAFTLIFIFILLFVPLLRGGFSSGGLL